jgi:hypothetical protein
MIRLKKSCHPALGLVCSPYQAIKKRLAGITEKLVLQNEYLPPLKSSKSRGWGELGRLLSLSC